MIVIRNYAHVVRCDGTGCKVEAPFRGTGKTLTSVDVDYLRSRARKQGWTVEIVGNRLCDVCPCCRAPVRRRGRKVAR